MKKLIHLIILFIFSPASVSLNAALQDNFNRLEQSVPVSVLNEDTGDSIEIYPNPVTDGRITIVTGKQIQSVQILNITGKIIFNREYPVNTSKVEIEMNNPEKGLYLVRITFIDRKVHTEKIMVK